MRKKRGNLLKVFKGDRIKGLKLWRFGKLNFTYHGKLQCRSGLSTTATAEDEGEKESLVFCSSSTAAAIYIAVAVDELQ